MSTVAFRAPGPLSPARDFRVGRVDAPGRWTMHITGGGWHHRVDLEVSRNPRPSPAARPVPER